jgi:starch phosphorylase
LVLANPKLTALISSKIGDGWIRNLTELNKLEEFAYDSQFQEQWEQIKLENKHDQLNYIYQKTGVKLNPDSLFDVHVKRIHEYKRQHLNILHIITLFNRIKKHSSIEVTPQNICIRRESCTRL